MGKTSDFDFLAQGDPAKMLHQASDDHFQGNAMQGIIAGLGGIHRGVFWVERCLPREIFLLITMSPRWAH